MNQDFFKRLESNGVYLNDVQKKAVLITDGPILLLASPGSGKTTTLISKIGYLIEEKGVDPQKILAVTFSRASAADMRERFQKLFPHISDPIHFSTIHSFAFRVVREYFKENKVRYQLIEGEVDREQMVETNGEADNLPLHKKVILRNLFKNMVGESITEDQMEELLTYISYVKNKLIKENELSQVKTNLPYAEQIFCAYESFKQRNPQNLLLDYDDMLTFANRILEENPNVLKMHQSRFSYILTDESQDTSLVQNLIIEKLAMAHRNICVVADDDQTIYSWRGAEPEYLLHFRDVYPDATILFMEQNYRSTKDVVEVANAFIKRNKNRYSKNMFTENGYLNPIVVKDMGTYDEQIRYVVEEIKKANNLSEIAVLYRNNSSSISLINELEIEGIPFYVKDADNKFFKHWIVEDILNFMRLSYNDKRPDILEKIHTKFVGYISKQQVEFLKSIKNQESVFDNLLNHLNLETYQIKRLMKCKTEFQRIKTMKPKEAIGVIRKNLGYEKAIAQVSERLGFSKENLEGILNTLERIADKAETLPDFAKRLKHLEDVIEKSRLNKNKNAVTLSTLHSSKGLEFDQVYMIDLVNGIIPSHEDIDEFKNKRIEKMEESARLFYVGMTRARKHLELISYKQKDGETLQESIFVKDVKNILHRYTKNNELLKEKDEIGKTKKPIEFQLGDFVHHVVFGLGKIEKLSDNIISIRFQTAGLKTLALSICLEKKLIEPVKEKS